MAKKSMMLRLDADVYDLITELSTEMATPASTLVARLITDSKPRFKATLDALKLAKGNSLMSLDNLDALADSVISDAAKVKSETSTLKKKFRKSDLPKG